MHGWPRCRHPHYHLPSGASAGQDDGMDFTLSDLGHLAHASERRLYTLVGWMLCIVPSKVHHPFEQRAHLSELVEAAMRTLRQIDRLFSPEEPLDEAFEFLTPHQC
jgi:hypothetical protein